jgi:hypothetical protein
MSQQLGAAVPPSRISLFAAAIRISPATTRQARRDAEFSRGDFRLCQSWYSGPAEGGGRVLISVNEYRPHTFKDVLGTALSGAQLTAQEVMTNAGAVGIVSAYDPRRHITYSLSVWRSEEALKGFTVAPAHLEIMREYRSRGYLRHVHWWGAHRSIGTSFAEATRRLDQGEGRRVGAARDPWATADQERLATLGAKRDR